MNLTFTGNQNLISLVAKGSEVLLESLDLPDGSLLLNLEEIPAGQEAFLKKEGSVCTLAFREPSQYFLLLNRALHHLDGDFALTKTPFFRKRGFMLDCSRNAAATPEKLRSMILNLAKMGMNQLLLYMEDSYEVPGYPYFGAYRGRYSQAELRGLDQFCSLFGIELIPCVQTLAHLHNFLRWEASRPFLDTPDILKVGSDQVYSFLRALLESLKDCFSTRNIHIGMDEANALGLGNYLKENGYQKSSLLMREHADKVLALCRETGWTPMMWSDMFITSNTGKGYYEVDASTDPADWEKPPAGLGMVYWDYYCTQEEPYHTMLRIHRELSERVVFAGGVWNWNGMAPNYGRAFRCTQMALKACREEGIQEVFATAWMDNGAETPLDAVWPGLAAFAFLCFHREWEEEKLRLFFRDCLDAELEDFCVLDDFDALFKGTGKNFTSDNPSKYLLYQDPLLGLFDFHLSGVNVSGYYSCLAERLRKLPEKNPAYETFFRFYALYALVLSRKGDLGLRIKTAYDRKDRAALERICREDIPLLLEDLSEMRILREALWFADARPMGYEVLDLKLGGVMTRLQACVRRLTSWLDGHVKRLEELEQERLPYWTSGNPELRENLWDRIISASGLMDTV